MTDPAPEEIDPHQGLYVLEDAAAYSITAAKIQPPKTIVIRGADGQPLVTIHTEDGHLEYGPGYEPDEAARRFWEAIEQWRADPLPGDAFYRAQVAVEDLLRRDAPPSVFVNQLWQRFRWINRAELAASQHAQEQVRLLTEGVLQRSALLEECRDILEQAGQNGAHGDDWPRIAPAVRAMAAELATARQQVKRLDAMADAWARKLPDTIATVTAVEAVHQVTRPQEG